jgi:hypothetical protein
LDFSSRTFRALPFITATYFFSFRLWLQWHGMAWHQVILRWLGPTVTEMKLRQRFTLTFCFPSIAILVNVMKTTAAGVVIEFVAKRSNAVIRIAVDSV